MNKEEEFEKIMEAFEIRGELKMNEEEKLVESCRKCTIAWIYDLAMHHKEYGIEPEDLPLFLRAIKNGFDSIMETKKTKVKELTKWQKDLKEDIDLMIKELKKKKK